MPTAPVVPAGVEERIDCRRRRKTGLPDLNDFVQRPDFLDLQEIRSATRWVPAFE
ncbi:hypothetical protein OG379_40095 (plasmid) [Streptomyces sp. NBC_01166]|uniref:hypothetical protein n=1 Tax=Streptomyces sp. NBC_01166 TaxID=2903755 RepID=UPI002F90D4FE|nr:hypothetical protein OG379_40095 [Streptomyces sp. NBC_01166]